MKIGMSSEYGEINNPKFAAPRGKLIGIVGYAGAGKTTITRDALTRWNGPRETVHHNFSRPIVNMLAAMGIPQAMLDDKSRWNEPLDILCGHSIRYAATTLGTEWGREHIGIDVWTRIALANADQERAKGHHVVIDNVRFPSEMDAMIEAGCVDFIAMNRGAPTNIKHASEQYIEDLQLKCSVAIYNNGTFSEAVEKMRKIIVDIIAR